MIDSYDKNRKPIVKPIKEEKPIRQYATNLSPIEKPESEKAPFSEKVMPKNSVTKSSSAKLQKASRLPGRVGSGKEHKWLS